MPRGSGLAGCHAEMHRSRTAAPNAPPRTDRTQVLPRGFPSLRKLKVETVAHRQYRAVPAARSAPSPGPCRRAGPRHRPHHGTAELTQHSGAARIDRLQPLIEDQGLARGGAAVRQIVREPLGRGPSRGWAKRARIGVSRRRSLGVGLSFLRAAAHYGPFRKEILPNGPWITYHAWWLFRLTAGGVWWPPPGSRLGGSPGTAVSRLTRSPGGQSEFGFGWAELVAAQDGHASAARTAGRAGGDGDLAEPVSGQRVGGCCGRDSGRRRPSWWRPGPAGPLVGDRPL